VIKLPYFREHMRRTRNFLLASVIAAAPMPVAAQVSVDLNALNGLGGAKLPAPPPSAPRALQPYHHRMRHLARATRAAPHPEENAVASASQASPGPETIEHPANLGPSFTSLPALPVTAPPAPPPPPALPTQAVAANPRTPPAPPKPAPEAKPAAAPPAAPALALPGAAPPPPALAPMPPTRLAEATLAPPAAQPPRPAEAPKAAANGLPIGADRLTLPFFVQESDLPPAENAMLRDFAQRYGAKAQYVVRAFASAPAGDDDPSTPRRIALERAQSVAAALLDSGVQPDRVRLLALGNAGGTPADRVEVIAMPPSSGHTNTDSSP
jgi:outer membrane protein OmpA-like peptidoglycan-associated protein